MTDPYWSIVCGPANKHARVDEATKLELWYFYDRSNESTRVKTVFADLRCQWVANWSDAVVIETGNYRLRRLVVLTRSVRQEPRTNDKRLDRGLLDATPGERVGHVAKIKGERFEVLTYALANKASEEYVRAYLDDPFVGADSLGGPGFLGDFKGGVAVAPSYWRDLEGHLTVRPSQLNEWTITMPDEMIAAVRKALKGDSERRSQ